MREGKWQTCIAAAESSGPHATQCPLQESDEAWLQELYVASGGKRYEALH